MACNCKHCQQDIENGKRVLANIRDLFIKRMTVDSDHHDARRRDFNQAIFCDYGTGEHEQVFCGTTMEMVLRCFDDAVKDWQKSWCDSDSCTRK